MNFLTGNRLIKSALKNFFRNIWISLAATSMVTITLLIISTMIILYTLAHLSIQNSTDKVGVVTAYFKDKTTDREIDQVRDEISALPGVKGVEYTSKDEAKANFAERHQNEPVMLQTLNEFTDSESPVPASLSIKAQNLTDYQEIYNTVKSERFAPFFQTIRDNQKVIEKLYGIIQFITRFGLLLAIIFVLVTILVTFNTIRLTIYNRRQEVEIMRLVGATNWYIRWPFLIEGLIYAFIATAFTSLIVFVSLYFLSGRIEQFLSINSLGSTLIDALFWKIVLANFVSSVILTIIASSIAIRRYLRI